MTFTTLALAVLALVAIYDVAILALAGSVNVVPGSHGRPLNGF